MGPVGELSQDVREEQMLKILNETGVFVPPIAENDDIFKEYANNKAMNRSHNDFLATFCMKEELVGLVTNPLSFTENVHYDFSGADPTGYDAWIEENN